MSLKSLYSAPRVKHPLLYGEAGGRIKKELGYNRNYQGELRATLEASDLIMVTDITGNVEFYMVDPRTKPMLTGRKTKMMATKWGTPLPAAVGGSNAGRNATDFTETNVALGEMALWKVFALSPNFMFDIEQPQNTPVTSNGIKAISLNYGNTGYYAKHGMWGAVPEIATFEDKATPTLNVYSYNQNESTFNALIGYIGYRYKLIKTEVPDPSDEPRVVQTVMLSSLI